MKIDDVKNICVIGAGNMGHQISLNAAIYGYKTVCWSRSQETVDKAKAFAETYLPERVAKGKLSFEAAEKAAKNIHFTTDFEEAAKKADFAIETAAEKIQIKKEIFTDLDKYCPSHTILASNSSFIASSLFANYTKRPEKVCNMHFFNPALVMPVVEVVKGPHTSQETVEITMELTRCMGKTPVLLNKEIEGFIVNRILRAINDEALFLAENGYASIEDIDIAVEGGLKHPMGPFRLMDLTGIDLAYLISQENFEKTGKPEDAPSPIIAEKYEAGDFGRKTGKGFYNYI